MAERLIPDYTLLIEVVIFLAILLVLTKFLFNPIMRVLSERKKRIEGAREEAIKLRDKVQEMTRRYDDDIAQARKENQKLIEQLKAQGDELGREMIRKAKAESEKSFNESKEKIWKEAKELENKLKSTAEEISGDLTAKILK